MHNNSTITDKNDTSNPATQTWPLPTNNPKLYCRLLIRRRDREQADAESRDSKEKAIKHNFPAKLGPRSRYCYIGKDKFKHHQTPTNNLSQSAASTAHGCTPPTSTQRSDDGANWTTNACTSTTHRADLTSKTS